MRNTRTTIAEEGLIAVLSSAALVLQMACSYSEYRCGGCSGWKLASRQCWSGDIRRLNLNASDEQFQGYSFLRREELKGHGFGTASRHTSKETREKSVSSAGREVRTTGKGIGDGVGFPGWSEEEKKIEETRQVTRRTRHGHRASERGLGYPLFGALVQPSMAWEWEVGTGKRENVYVTRGERV